MRNLLFVSFAAFLCFLAAPVHAAADVFLAIDAGTYAVALNGVLDKICGGRSVQLVSRPPTAERNGATDRKIDFPIARVKKGEVLGSATLVTDGESFPFNVELKGVTVSDARVRGNGTWTMTIQWSSCTNVARR